MDCWIYSLYGLIRWVTPKCVAWYYSTHIPHLWQSYAWFTYITVFTSTFCTAAAGQCYRRGRIHWQKITGNVEMCRSCLQLAFYAVVWYQPWISGIKVIRSSRGRDYRYQWSGAHWMCWTRLERIVICGRDE